METFSAKHEDMLRAICAAAHGEAIFSSTVAARMMDVFAGMRPAKLPQVFPDLSEREREILNLIAEDYKNPEIAEQLVLSPKTIRNHVSTILSRHRVADRAQAILKAGEAGLGMQKDNETPVIRMADHNLLPNLLQNLLR